MDAAETASWAFYAMARLSRHVRKILWDDGEFVLSRCTLADQAAPVLVLAPVSERPAPGIIARMEHAYALREQLDPSSLARPLRLVHERALPELLLDDPGGDPLAGLLGRPWELTQFLRVGAGLAAALGRLHARQLIHGDVKPSNILVNVATGQAWLIGICFAPRLPRSQVPTRAEVIAGSLAYMSPEQTGRMNRSVDSRSDLYSLGIILYQMLTGVLPHHATDPAEWVHCHIARQPVPPSALRENIPATLSAVVLKLLAKTAEERYQTATGVEADLERCLLEWGSAQRIDPFPLGAHDISDRLIMPEKLYGRDREIKALLGALDQVVSTGRPNLVLVSGYSGIGKSSVVNEVHQAMVQPRGIFISGKFDEHKRDIPYATFAQDAKKIWDIVPVHFFSFKARRPAP
jgi:serine/threonine protein kinase